MTLDEIKVFCAIDDARWNLLHPWTRDGYTWATNGHIIVRVPAMDDVPENNDAPDAGRLMAKAPDDLPYFPVPECTMPAPISCSWCDGTGRDPNDKRCRCDECDGTKTEEDILQILEN